MVKIYGVARSRAFRTLWMAHELGLGYEHVKIDFAGQGTRSPEMLKLNPNGHVPVVDDDGFILWESMAINLYLAKKYSPGMLYPGRLEDEARAWQWSFWGMTEVERPSLTALLNRVGREPDPAAADEAEKALAAPLKVLDGIVGADRYLLGPQFTVADLNVAGILAWARQARVDLAPFPNTAAWLRACHDRPAARAARDLQRE
jgi:glutathione S-transferase